MEADTGVTTPRILLATDGSAGAAAAARLAADWASTHDADVVVVHVVALPWSFDLTGTTPVDSVERYLRDEADRALDVATDILDDAEVKYTTAVVYGSPAPVLLDIADREAVDVIVIGRRGMSTFERIVLGSVSARVVAHAHCPVLVAGPARHGAHAAQTA